MPILMQRQGGPAMKIVESAVQFNSQHAALEKNEKKESLTVWNNAQERRQVTDDPRKQEIEALRRKALEQSVKVSLSAEARESITVHENSTVSSESGDVTADLNLRILQLLIERLTGKKVSISDLKALIRAEDAPAVKVPSQNDTPQGGARNSGFGAVYEYHASHYEAETTSFAAQGKILTADGKQVDFSVQLNMMREYSSQKDETIRIGNALKDPLVINFEGNAVELAQTKFAFDLNADGEKEQIAFVGPGSGFLALDKNGDNIINNGTELFGPGSGNGFNELAAYDTDGNDWIDENDAVYGNVRIWTKDNAGNDQLLTLRQKGIGALFLGNAATPFSLKNDENELAGQVRSTGIFLQENGAVGTLQQIDLVA
jgi:hypothetical protein